MEEKSDRHSIRSAQIEVIAAALLFSLSVPVGKLILAHADPLALSGVLYLSGGGFSAILVLLDRRRHRRGPAAPMRPSEWITLGGAVAAGGVLAPLALFAGLRLIAGHVAGLLLNFETLFTISLGVILSGEHLGRRGWLGAAAIVTGAILLSWGSVKATQVDWRGVLLVIGACALWGLDNNLTQRVSIRDARAIVAVKGLAGGATSLLLALALGRFGRWTPFELVVAIPLGSASFGVSIALFVRGLRRIGVVQTGTLFALAPGLAALLSWLFLGDVLLLKRVVAFGGMTAGALLLMSDPHGHPHVHEVMEHLHPHEHDAHHDHEHRGVETGTTPHTHVHRHERLAHDHPHVHDIHHRHRK